MNRTMNIKGFLVILSAVLVTFFALHLMLRSDLHRKADKENALRLALSKLEDENKDLNNRLSIVGRLYRIQRHAELFLRQPERHPF